MRMIGPRCVLALAIVRAAVSGAAIAADPPASDPRALAAKIDARLADRWAAGGIRPSARADDAEFLRRACLDLVGKIPGAAEARDFLDDPNPEKRSALVDRLIESPAYAARAALLWRQLLLPPSDSAQVATGDLDAWLRKKVDEGAGYDRIVRDVLTARLATREGSAMAARSGPSPAAFFLAKGGKPETLAADSARAFLGLRLGCAECHNHPFARWKREEFWSFAAFFSEVPRQPDDDGAPVVARREAKDLHRLTIPGTSKVVEAGHLDHAPPLWRPRADAREVLADWVVSPENPYFARAAVNRTWARFFGIGLIDPVDDLDAEDEFGLGGLLDELASEFRAHNYDLKFLIRAITATRAYNLSSAIDPDGSTAPPLFARMPVRGLSPSQFFDSLAQATGCDPSEARNRLSETFADRDERPTESQTTILQALTLMNGGLLASLTSPEGGDVLGAIAGAPYLDTPGRVEALYLATLTRRPRPDELALIVRHVDRRESEADRSKALADVFWALLNGPEFRSNH